MKRPRYSEAAETQPNQPEVIAMNHLFPASFKRLVLPGLALLAGAVFFAPSAAHATPYVVKLVQQGNNVIATGSGAIDLTGLTYSSPGQLVNNFMDPDGAYFSAGLPGNEVTYTGFTGPSSFGNGGGALATTGTGTGDGVVLIGSATFYGEPLLFVPVGYVSGLLTSEATWDSASFASLGVTAGTYVWTWGKAADQSFTLMIGGGTASVPEPAALGMFGLGLLLLGGFTTLRRREPPQIG